MTTEAKSECSSGILTKKQYIMLAVLIGGTFVTVLNQTIISPALPKIMVDMNITASTAQWLTTAFMLVNGIMIPITAFFVSKFSTRKLYIAAMTIFGIGTFLAGYSPNFTVLLLGRILQAVAAGILMPMVQTIVLLVVPRKHRGSAMGMIGLIIGFAPALGPTVAGVVIDHLSWHFLFYALVPLTIMVIILAFFVLENVGETTNPTLDILSVIYSTLGFGGLLYSFSAIGSYGVQVPTIIACLIGIVALILFFRRQLSMEQPLLEVRVLSNNAFLYSTIITMIINAALIVGGILTPIYIQSIRGFGATVSGLMMLPGAIVMGIMSPITGRLFDKIGPRKLAIPGLCILTIFSFFLTILNEDTSIFWLTFVYTTRMFGMSLVMMPLNTWGLNALENQLLPHGTAVGNTFRTVAGSLGTAVLVTVMSITVSLAADPTSSQATIRGINVAFTVSTLLNAMALIMCIIKVPRNQ